MVMISVICVFTYMYSILYNYSYFHVCTCVCSKTLSSRSHVGITPSCFFGASVQDTDLPSVTASLDRLLEDLRGERLDTAESSESLHRPPVRALLEIDLSDNSISDPGAVFLFRWLLRRKEVRCRAIRLARNKLGDASMEWLAALICAQHSAIEEVHLSQNHITGSGAPQPPCCSGRHAELELVCLESCWVCS